MEGSAVNVGLGWLGVVVGAIGAIVAEEMAKSGRRVDARGLLKERRLDWLCAAVTLLVTLILFAVAMLKQAPFSPGQGLAYGLLIGGLFGSIETIRSAWLTEAASSVRTARLSTLASLFAGLAAVSVTYVTFAANPWEPLIGFATGVAMAAIFHTYMQHIAGRELSVRTEAWAVFSITVAAAILLSMRHFDATHLRVWWAMPILLATTVLVADYIGTEVASLGRLKENPAASYLVSVLVGAAITVGLVAIYAWKLYNDWSLLYAALAGFGVAIIVAWTFAGFARDESAASATEAGAASVLLVVAFAVVTFKLWAGLGIAVGLVAAWAVAMPALTAAAGAEERPKLLSDAALWPLGFGLAILLFRLFLQEYRPELRGSDLEIHYTFVGALLGAILPFILVSNVAKLREAKAGSFALLGVAVMGLVAAASPLILAVLWGDRSALGFVFGLIAAVAFMLLSRISYADARYSAVPLVIGAELTAIQFTRLTTDLEATRAVRIVVLAAVVLLCVVWFGVTSLYARRAR